MISFFFLPSTNKTMVANPFSGGFLRTKYKRLDSTWIKCIPINANHKLSERHFQSWGWEHSCLNAWIPLALISVLLVQRNENRKEFLFFFFSFAFTRRTKEKAPTCVKRCVFLFLLPNRSEFCTAEMSSLIRRCNGWTKADFSETRASGLMSFLTVWVQHWSICSLASCGRGRGGTANKHASSPAAKISNSHGSGLSS